MKHLIFTSFVLLTSLWRSNLSFAQVAEPQPNTIVTNQVLFSESDQSWTSRDLRLYESVMSQVLQKKNISLWSEGRNEDFLLSRLSFREAVAFGLQASTTTLTEVERKQIPEFTQKEIEDEVNRMALVLMFVDLKQNQLKQKDRFLNWFSHLKRKYQVRIKSAEANDIKLATPIPAPIK